MTVKQLSEMLQGIDPELQIVFMGDGEQFYSPCIEESGVIELGDPCDLEGNPLTMEDHWPTKMFALIAHELEEA